MCGHWSRGVWCGLVVALTMTSAAFAERTHGLSAFGDLKYPPGFPHFDYVNPDAPKGGSISGLDSTGRGAFDSLNPFIVRGTPAAGLERGVNGPPGENDLYFESLMARAMDTPDNLYGLVAHSVELGPERQWVTFYMREEARFHDGTPIRAADVVFSFNLLIEDGHPRYRLTLGEVEKAEALDALTVKFTFRDGVLTRDLPLAVGILPIFSKAYYTENEFDRTTLEPPLASGPYRIERVSQGRSITYKRDPDYWAKDLPVNVGRNNFDDITFEYYRDRSIGLEAFKAGEYTFRVEYTSKSWVTEYTGPAIDKGWIKRGEFDDNRPSGVQAWFINTRREKFADPRVRQALDLAFDFEWTQRTIFYGLYDRMDSIWENTVLEATGVPVGKELAVLEKYRDRLPAKIFEGRYMSPVTDGGGNNRRNLRAARALLIEAGWTVVDGVLQKDGTPFTLEFLEWQPSLLRIVEPYLLNLETLGITANIRMVDSAQYQARSEDYDFDMTMVRYIPSMPPGPEIRETWSSSGAEAVGTYNFSGVRDPVVDDLIEEVIGAQNREDMTAAAQALDRVIMHGHYMMPAWKSGKNYLAWWDQYDRPPAPPQYARGVLDLWWFNPEKAAALAGTLDGAQ